jgi:hypothetical protein
MFKKVTLADKLLLAAAFSSLIFAELMWFKGEGEGAIFVGLWVPSILGFGIYFKLLKLTNND